MSDAPHNESLQFDELHVVSDLHLGGTKHATDPRQNFQIFDQAGLFSACVDRLLRERRQPGQMCFVVNGDLVDFLAEPNPKCFDPEGAEQKLLDIVSRSEFVPVWDSLRKLARTPDVTLAIVLGNHDIELALPRIRQRLLQLLSRGTPGAQGRIHLVVDGTGFRCRVGNANVLCLHGNEVDEWNYVDYEKLREIGRDQQL
ncbi:MAG: metallophosphoesterase, partial [Planctomycetaceae bacterium]|nr:metallophosphoesterase [Planctomycetaceae bacterium]